MRRRLRRIRWVACAYLFLTAVLMGRLFTLSLFPNLISGTTRQRGWLGDAAVKAEMEHFDTMMQSDGRGHIRYRDGGVWAPSEGEIVGWIGLPDVWPSPTRSVQQQGRAGLEATFDRWLSGRPGYKGRLRDAHGDVHSGWAYRLLPRPGYDIRTTVDPQWQRAASDALDRASVVSGAVVVLDVRTHGVLAASGTWLGHPSPVPILHSDIPGSIYKLVTAAAALDSYSTRWNAAFFCDGFARIRGVHMRCWRIHGHLTLSGAIAQSCDATFASIGALLGPNPLWVMSHRLELDGASLQRIDGRLVLSEAEPGTVFGRQHRNESAAVLANTAIGQEDVRISPLSAANLACTIADSGVYRPAMLVEAAERHGNVMRTFRTPSRRVISASTATELALAMREAVMSPAGTAHALASSPVSVAVKTGTAELPQPGRVNGWIVGFAPYRDPQIAFAVYVRNQPALVAHRQAAMVTLRLLYTLSLRTAASDTG